MKEERGEDRKTLADRLARPTAWGIKAISWMVVGLCAVMMTVGFFVGEERQDRGGLPWSDTVLAQADGEQPADGAAPAADDKGTAVDAAVPKKNELKEDTSVASKAISFLGLLVFIGIAWALSNNRKKVNWKLVVIGSMLQIGFAVIIFYVPFGKAIFEIANDIFVKLLQFTDAGSGFIFGNYLKNEFTFALNVLPTIIFFSSLMTVLYHLGIMQAIVKAFAWVMLRVLGTSGAETMSASANIFVGQTEAPLVIKPFIDKMTMSELMTVMTGGFATVAGGVLAAYIGMLKGSFPDIGGHLIAASVMSAPAALVIGKIMYPETETPETMGELKMEVDRPDANVIEAAARGAGEGLTLAVNVGAMLLAFLALVAMFNYALSLPSFWQHRMILGELIGIFEANKVVLPEACANLSNISYEASAGCVTTLKTAAAAVPELAAQVPASETWGVLSIQQLLGYLFWPVAFVMGVPSADCYHIAQLLGTKMVVNEFLAYADLSTMLSNPDIVLSKRSVVIATYALCGFANFGSIAIQIGGLGGIAPSRRKDLAKLGLRAMIAGSIAAFMTATIAGILI